MTVIDFEALRKWAESNRGKDGAEVNCPRCGKTMATAEGGIIQVHRALIWDGVELHCCEGKR
jgi:hypothetical protein